MASSITFRLMPQSCPRDRKSTRIHFLAYADLSNKLSLHLWTRNLLHLNALVQPSTHLPTCCLSPSLTTAKKNCVSVPMDDSEPPTASNGHSSTTRSSDTLYAFFAVKTTLLLILSHGLGIGPPATISKPSLTQLFWLAR